jgi:hypothetical protein
MKTPAWLNGAVAALITSLTFPAHGSAPEDRGTAANFLTFETKIDGRCHNLSEGGKLAVMRNNHPTETIDFRLIRYHVDVPQWGRVTGTAAPGGPPVKLGCTLVGGREQRWVIERAQFTTEPNQ